MACIRQKVCESGAAIASGWQYVDWALPRAHNMEIMSHNRHFNVTTLAMIMERFCCRELLLRLAFRPCA